MPSILPGQPAWNHAAQQGGRPTRPHRGGRRRLLRGRPPSLRGLRQAV